MRFVLGFLCFFALFGITSTTYAYVFGLKSFDNTIENILKIEKEYNINIPLVSIILDPYVYQDTIYHYAPLEFLTGKIYHFTISPGGLTASQVANGKFDKEYREFFEFVKEKKIKVIFRTMHEMNGDWYPWAGNSYRFKKARKRVRKISRTVGLDQSQILFDFSLNHRDKVKIGNKSTRCYLGDRRTECKTWENYYPGPDYVDILGFTFYNRGKATSDRSWLRPQQILIDDGAGLFERLEKKHKPVIIDEVGTTKVYYNDRLFDFSYSQRQYWNAPNTLKNMRLQKLSQLISKNSMIKAMIYFNIDYTQGLTHHMNNEADRAIIDFQSNMYFTATKTLLEMSEDGSALEKLFLVPIQ